MKKDNISVMIIGSGEHGKTDVADKLIKELGWRCGESSFVCRGLVFDKMIEMGYLYPDAEACWADRRNHRLLWKKIIKDYNTPNLDNLIKLIYTEHEIYCGIRDNAEFATGYRNGLFDIIIFVDARERLGLGDVNDFNMPPGVADIIIPNNGTKEAFHEALDQLVALFKAGTTGHATVPVERFSGLRRPSPDEVIKASDWLMDVLKNIDDSNKHDKDN